MAVRVDANLDGVFGYVGAVDGILTAVANPRFEGDFGDWILSDLKDKFTADAIAVNMSGAGGISHVFEWGPQTMDGIATGQPSSIPLFRLTKGGSGANRVISFHFVPSTKPVPLPDPDKYGFKPSKLQYLRRHIFKYKAIVMETQAQVTIAPTFAKKLFIPLASADRGYIMTSKPVTVNPGGEEASGGFSQFWLNWFETVAPGHVTERSQLAEQMIAKTGRRVIRDATGRFARGESIGIAYVSSSKRMAELETLTAAKNYFSDGPLDDWEE